MESDNLGEEIIDQVGELVGISSPKEFWPRNAKTEDSHIDASTVHVSQFAPHVVRGGCQRNAQALATVEMIGAVDKAGVGEVTPLLQHPRHLFQQNVGMHVDTHGIDPLFPMDKTRGAL